MKDIRTLLRENKQLRAQLALAKRWMTREVQGDIWQIQRQSLQKNTRSYFANLFEQEGKALIENQLFSLFQNHFVDAPKFTLERLMDAEVYWYTLQKYPTMDALPIVVFYQKILDDWVEEKIGAPFRKSREAQQLQTSEQEGIEKDIGQLLSKKYQLSLGRFYKFLEILRTNTALGHNGMLLASFLEKNDANLFARIQSDAFFLPFADLIAKEVFSRKRHKSKVTFVDAQDIRHICIGDDGLFLQIF